MPFPTPFNSQSSEIISYDYSDIAEGAGIQQFYGARDETGTFFLSSNQVYSNLIESTVNGAVKSCVFETGEFNAPKTIFGTAMITFCSKTLGATGAIRTQASINLYRVSGGVDTLLGAASGALIAGSDVDTTHVFRLPITTRTAIKKGDKIKLNAFFSSTDAGCSMSIGHDPMNRNGTNITPSSDEVTTQLKTYVPFELPNA